MSLMIRHCLIIVFSSIFLCSLTGTLLFFVWKWVSDKLEKYGFIHIVYVLLKLIMFAYICPVVVVILLRYFWDGIIFTLTPFISNAISAVTIIWSVGFIIRLAKYLIRRHQFEKTVLLSEVESKETKALFEACKEIVGVKKEIRLTTGIVPVPFVKGTLKPTIVLPKDVMEPDHLKIIFYHELMHIKHQDLAWKVFGNVLIWIHWYFPALRSLFRQYDDWSETYCDFSVYTLIKSRKQYFHILYQIAKQDTELGTAVCSAIYEDENGLVRRIERAKRIGKMNSMKFLSAMGLIFIFCFAGTVTVAGTTVVFQRGYLIIVDITTTGELIRGGEEELQKKEKQKEQKIKQIYQIVNFSIVKTENKGIYIIKPKYVRPNTEAQTKSCYFKKGEIIKLTFLIAQEDDIKVENKKVYLGLIREDQKRFFVEGSSDLTHNYVIEESGYYKVFFLNKSGYELQPAGDFRKIKEGEE